MKLTKSESAYLSVIPDWSAPYEVIYRLGRSLSFTSHGATVKVLDRLVSRGLATYSPANRTYKATFIGREALALLTKQGVGE